MNWFDYFLMLFFYAMGFWKVINLTDIYAPRFANWLIRKIENRQA